MKRKSNTLIYLIFASIVIFCLVIINLFIYLKDFNMLYEDKSRTIKDTTLNYPYFNNEKDIYIEEYLNIIDTTKVDDVKYLVNYLGEYTNIIFKLYQNDTVVDYYSILFNDKNNFVTINDLIFDDKILNEKVKLFIDINNLKISEKEYKIAKKSYLFKDSEMEIYLSNYKDDNTISLITINYWELKDNLNFPYELDKKYVLMIPAQNEENVVQDNTNPIIPPKELKDKKLVAFTFDDGPSKYTLEVLDILDEFNANATFFLVGYNIKIRNSIVLDLYNRGFELGNHTTDHSRLTKFNCSKANDKISQNNDLVKNITNEDLILFRPPYGAINETLVKCLNYPIILWSVDSRDWESRNTEMIMYEVLASVEDGSIVLFHDLYPTTVEAIKLLLPILYADNYEVVSVSELFVARDIPLENNKIYRKAS